MSCCSSCDSCDELGLAIGPEGPAGSSIVANTVFVAKNGNDSTGLVERLDKPFLTIAAARAAALTYWTGGTAPAYDNRKLIKVFSGTYEEQVVLAFGIDFDLSDCVVRLLSADNVFVIDDNGITCDSTIYGNSYIQRLASSSGGCIKTSNASTVLTIHCTWIQSTDPTYNIYCVNGSQYIYTSSFISGETYASRCVNGYQEIYCPSISGAFVSGGSGVQVIHGDITENGISCGSGSQYIYGNVTQDIDNAGAICSGSGLQVVHGNILNTSVAGTSASVGVSVLNSGVQKVLGNITTLCLNASAYGILFQKSGGDPCEYQGDVIATSASSIFMSGTGSSVCKVKSGSKIKTLAVAGESAVEFANNTCILVIQGTAIINTDLAIDSVQGAAGSLYVYDTVYANTAVAGTITQYIGTVVVDANAIY